MASYQESEHFAEDFREALEDLQTLQNHIKRVAAHKKLPSLYVLDSIIKNVGTPYTLFFGKRLFETYMDAYASVDMATRRKMDEMLKTWKEPIPGSIDTRPVFPPDVTRPIENALIKARTSAMQAQQQHYRNEQQLLGRGRPMAQQPQPPVPYRETPTPPNVRPSSQASGYPGNHSNGAGPYGPPPAQAPGQYPQHQNMSMPTRSTPQPSASMPAFQPPYPGGYGMPQPGISVDALNNDIQQLIAASKAEFARSPHDPSIQTRLKALLDLQSILQTQNLPQDQLVLIKNRIAELAVTIRATPAQTPTPVPIAPAVAVAPPSAPPAAPKVSIDSLLGSGALAALLARSSATPQASTPQPPPATMAIRSPPPQRVELPRQPTPAAPAPSDALSLMEMLRKAGMIPPPSTGPASGSIPAPNHTPTMPSMPLPFSLPRPAATGPPTVENTTSDMTLTTHSLKQFRPHLMPFLFDSLGTPCTQCGRRFKNDADGKKKKTAHMDWHFKVNQRIAEADKAGQNRGWLVDEQDWLNTRETIDVIGGVPTAQSNATQGGSVSKAPKMQYIPVPDDPVLLNSVCPICQEKFKQVYLDEEWVWEDALEVGDRIYHASCHREATGGSSSIAAVKYGGGGSRSTPEPVLGKRKAEQDDLTSLRAGKLKMEA
ncbi:mRNA cleavage factor complex component pcf11 [Apiospora arundinis]|uniref:mRNA cleavage factor complex component pcf11 n=1 Tax=Apiospora arundinis TaxID=335852 RepID=A0ABR2IGW9_9PEZI